MADRFGSPTTLGVPDINGQSADIREFPAATGMMGYYMATPGGNGGGSFVNEYTIIFDVLYPSYGVTRPLLDIGDGFTFVAGPEFIVSAAGGIGLPPNGPFDGQLAPNAWYRLGFTVTASQIRKYINGQELKVKLMKDLICYIKVVD